MKDFLSIKNVTFGDGSRTILEDVSLRFGSGQVVAIMGGSGMGKTTLLKLIGGLLTPQAGEICIAGCRVDTNDQKAQRGGAARSGAAYAVRDLRGYGKTSGFGSYDCTRSRVNSL